MRLLNILQRGLHLPIREQVAYLRLFILSLVVEIALRVLPFGFILRTLRIRTKWTHMDPDEEARPVLNDRDLNEASRVIRLMRDWPFVESACLRQAVVLALLLRRHQPLLCLGVTKLNGSIYAHAWIEIAGGTLGRQQGFTPFRVTTIARQVAEREPR